MARHRPLWLATLMLVALTGPIPQECSNGFTQAYPFCSDATARSPGSLCCNGLQQLGTDCLKAIQASLSSSNGPNSALQQLAALTVCGGSGSACCDPVKALGDACLAELAGTSDLFASVAFGQIAQTCGFDPNGGGGGGDVLPAGRIYKSWTALGKSGAACPVWNDNDFQDGTEPKWREWLTELSASCPCTAVATGTDVPSDAEILAVAERWCSNRESAVPEMLQALAAGGRSAQVAVAAYTLYTCPSDNMELWDVMGQDLISSDPFDDPDTALTYVKAMIDAAQQSGLNFCTTVVVLSNITGQVIYYNNFHVDPQADTPDGCLPNFLQVCCCALTSSIASSCGPFTDGPSTNTSGLLEGIVVLYYSAGTTGQCYSYNTSTGDWTPESNSTWAATANNEVSESNVQAFGNQMCPLAEKAGPLLVQAIGAGGDQAKVALFALTRTGVCSNDTAREAATQAFIDSPEMTDSSSVEGLVQAFIAAADQVGTGACISLAILDQQTDAILYQQDYHTGMAAPGSAPVLSRRRSLRGSAALGARGIKRLLGRLRLGSAGAHGALGQHPA
ncbi:hypothetical protein ABPG75_008517 [Micractinium tetrahymenae]